MIFVSKSILRFSLAVDPWAELTNSNTETQTSTNLHLHCNMAPSVGRKRSRVAEFQVRRTGRSTTLPGIRMKRTSTRHEGSEREAIGPEVETDATASRSSEAETDGVHTTTTATRPRGTFLTTFYCGLLTFPADKKKTNKQLPITMCLSILSDLEPDHERRPLWITEDGQLFLEVVFCFLFCYLLRCSGFLSVLLAHSGLHSSHSRTST